ncbi:LysE family translocator [Pseudaminobacter soli (ex Li et al. 2025)]|uniref:Lysine transporter LysE n=1 Tax=Pseudaminobacter soli (ex Li et al. 2025) TaxID=1295366 RepID=A0A2P7SHS7_9HYPH|nr:LysE family transporter [Mesorhizobium soli]PSJ62052.1 lysine transporter LysE [Mesorhizobium soli]
MNYVWEFAGLMAVFSLLAVAPGADFALVVRQSITRGRRAAIAASVGIGTSLMFHITYTVLGIGLIVSKSLFLFGILKWAGAAYLLYLGIKALRSTGGTLTVEEDKPAEMPVSSRRTDFKNFLMGFVTNALNPKAVLFFLSLFSALVSYETPVLVQGVYGLLMAAFLISWFVIVSIFFTMKSVRDRFVALGRWFDRFTGLVFIGLGIKLAVQQQP